MAEAEHSIIHEGGDSFRPVIIIPILLQNTEIHGSLLEEWLDKMIHSF